MPGAKDRWDQVQKKVLKFRDQHPECHVICIAMVDNTYRFQGDEMMKQLFASSDDIKEKFKGVLNATSQQLFTPQGNSDPPMDDSVEEALSKHCFDMDMSEMRCLIGVILTPSSASSARENKRNFFEDENNCPLWWQRTSVPFVSLNHPKPGQRRPTIREVYELIESLQDHYHIVPGQPLKKSRVNYRSRFMETSVSSISSSASASANNANYATFSPASATVSPASATVSPASATVSPASATVSPASATSTNAPDTNTTNDNTNPSDTDTNCTNPTTNPTDTNCTNPSATNCTNPSATNCTNPSATNCTNPSATNCTNTSATDCTIPSDNATRPENCISLMQRRHQLLELAQESIEQNSLQLLRILGSGHWDELLALSGELLRFIPSVPTTLVKEWSVPELLSVNERYKDFIPGSVGKRKCLASSADGNCIYNAFSISIYGDESKAFLLRLSSVAKMADRILEYSKYIAEEMAEETLKWVASISGNEYTVPDVSGGELVEYVCQQELLLTAKNPYRDCTLFHMHILANHLQRPVINHYMKASLVFPYMENIFPCLSPVSFPQPIHLVWVPTKPSRYASLRHVVPAVCPPGPYGAHFEECGFTGLYCCAFFTSASVGKANPDITTDWVECTLCGQWVHGVCMKIDVAAIKDEDPFLCGCDRLIEGQFQLQSIEWYNRLTIDFCKSEVDFENVVKDKSPSLRSYIYKTSGFKQICRSLRVGRFGPFNDDLIHEIMMALSILVPKLEHHLVPDIFLPEVLLRLIEFKEGCNRLIAEKALMQRY